MVKKAIVLLSGGMDSATTLAIATQKGHECYALSFRYGQRHDAELQAAEHLASHFNAKLQRVIDIDLSGIMDSALTNTDITIPEQPGTGIPATYVPARNTVFLSIALAWAEVIEAQDIFIGVNAVDYSGYPDCRPEYINAFQKMANLATKAAVEGNEVRINTPLIHLSKAEIIKIGMDLGLDFAWTVSCYQADQQGLACGKCDACRLRRSGFESAGITDNTRYINS
ncbi:MAG: 7-cyano-7-deazaguanine synthase QueC [Thiothrix sp.]|nr:MAG: 7-cyano-7-deazaguanine synthase QueC [Thiothrix sp.]